LSTSNPPSRLSRWRSCRQIAVGGASGGGGDPSQPPSRPGGEREPTEPDQCDEELDPASRHRQRGHHDDDGRTGGEQAQFQAGAAYLVYLGIRTLLPLRSSEPEEPSPSQGAAAEGSPFRQGLLTNLLNPKIAVMFTSLIPQFVSPGPSATLESVALAGIFATLGLIWLASYAIVASAAAGWLLRPRVKRALAAVTGAVLVGLGVRLATEPR